MEQRYKVGDAVELRSSKTDPVWFWGQIVEIKDDMVIIVVYSKNISIAGRWHRYMDDTERLRPMEE